MQAIYKVYSSHLPERANATYEISVVSYTYAAKGIMWSEVHFQRAPAKNCAARFCGKRSGNVAKLAVAKGKRHKAKVCRDAVSYTYAAKCAYNVEGIKKPKGLNHKIIIRRNM